MLSEAMRLRKTELRPSAIGFLASGYGSRTGPRAYLPDSGAEAAIYRRLEALNRRQTNSDKLLYEAKNHGHSAIEVSPEDLSKVPTGNERIPEPTIIVIFGASGDLTKRKLLPALYHLNITDCCRRSSLSLASHGSRWANEFAADMRAGIVEFGSGSVGIRSWMPSQRRFAILP